MRKTKPNPVANAQTHTLFYFSTQTELLYLNLEVQNLPSGYRDTGGKLDGGEARGKAKRETEERQNNPKA